MSRAGRGSADGAGTAADWTDRAGESSLELLLESLLPEKNRFGEHHLIIGHLYIWLI